MTDGAGKLWAPAAHASWTQALDHLQRFPPGEPPLALAFCPKAPVLLGAVPGRPAPGGRVAEVLVPDRGVAPGLRRLLRSGGNSLQTPDDWVGRIQGSPLALVVADRESDT